MGSDQGGERHIRVAREGSFGGDTPQTAGLVRTVAFDERNPDADVLSAFRIWVAPGAATGAHHHGPQETILYVIEGHARYRWGDRLENELEAGPGDFVFIPAHVVHQEINASDEEPTVWAVVRSGREPVVVNLPELDEIALRSHTLAHQATEEGRFEREMIPWKNNGDTFVVDQGIRPPTEDSLAVASDREERR